MVYRFACPVPCQRVIKVHAASDEEAIEGILIAGAMSCRNATHRTHCEKVHRHMPPFSREQLREIVRLSMEAEPMDPVSMAMGKGRLSEGAAALCPYR